MGEFILGINWTAVFVTAIVSATAIKTTDKMVRAVRIWLEGLRTQLAIEKEISGRFKR